MNDLAEASRVFATRYHAHPALVAEQRGWSRRVLLVASDRDSSVTLRVEDGRVVEITTPNSSREPADVTITADHATLLDVLELRRSPNEPYLFGELTVRGPEADFLRLDYLLAALCAH